MPQLCWTLLIIIKSFLIINWPITKKEGGGGDLFEDYKAFHLCRTLFWFTTNINRIYLHENTTDLELFNARCEEHP